MSRRVRRRPDGFTVRQFAFAGLAFLAWALIFGEAVWRDQIWRRTTATTVAASEVCRVEDRRGRRRSWDVYLSCTEFERMRELLARNYDEVKSYWRVDVRYLEVDGAEHQATVVVEDNQFRSVSRFPAGIAKLRRSVGLRDRMVTPGMMFEIAHSRWFHAQVDLAENLKPNRQLLVLLFIAVGVLVFFFVIFDVIPANEEERRQLSYTRPWYRL